jgi:hypothetical protein
VYGGDVQIDWDQFDVHSAFLTRECTPGGCTNMTSFAASHVFWSRPGTTGHTIHIVTLTVLGADHVTIVRQLALPVAIKNVAPDLDTLTFSPAPRSQGQEVTMNASVLLADDHTPLIAKATWKDSSGTTTDTVNVAPGVHSFQIKHVLRENGTKFALTVADDASGLDAT